MKVAIHQPNFLPWLGYFFKLAKSDFFVFYDDVQFEKGGYTNRTSLPISGQPKWFTQSIQKRGILDLEIKDIKFSDQDWKRKHLACIEQQFRKHPFFLDTFDLLRLIYSFDSDCMSEFNVNAILEISKYLHIETRSIKSSDLAYEKEGDATDRLISICKSLNADEYLAGGGGVKYQLDEKFSRNGIGLVSMTWAQEPYHSPSGYMAGQSIIDALFCVGKESVFDIIFQCGGRQPNC